MKNILYALIGMAAGIVVLFVFAVLIGVNSDTDIEYRLSEIDFGDESYRIMYQIDHPEIFVIVDKVE